MKSVSYYNNIKINISCSSYNIIEKKGDSKCTIKSHILTILDKKGVIKYMFKKIVIVLLSFLFIISGSLKLTNAKKQNDYLYKALSTALNNNSQIIIKINN